MNVLNFPNILLTGLPGSGKSTVALALKKQFNCSVLNGVDVHIKNTEVEFTRPGCFEWQDFITPPVKNTLHQVWCVIDIRSILPGEECSWLKIQLRNLLQAADGVVFTFCENSPLDNQAWWNQWVANNRLGHQNLPITRMLNNTLPATFCDFSLENDGQAILIKTPRLLERETEKIECFHFELERVVLEHLLMVLDNARQNLGMKITRVTGSLRTLEYQNAVSIEGTPYRWDTYASNSEDNLGELLISGVGLEYDWLLEMMNACRA